VGVPPKHSVNRPLTADELECNINGLAVTDNKLREQFALLDEDGNGWIPYEIMVDFFKQQESFGLEPTDAEVALAIGKYHNGDNRITYDEFCCIMLSIAQR
jgi:Ca2+-binding EF-hand superfamily protein